MKRLFIVANWKSNKTTSEALSWLQAFKDANLQTPQEKEIIIAASFTLLPQMNWFIKTNNLPIKLAGQDVASTPEGPYTGAVNAKQLKEFAEYVLIGHSERKTNFKEDDEMLAKKVEQALAVGLQPIFFVQDETTPVPAGVQIVVDEPPGAISTVSNGVPEDPEAIGISSEQLKQRVQAQHILYGGSVNSENVASFTALPVIEGVVPGKASLDAESFIQIIKNS